MNRRPHTFLFILITTIIIASLPLFLHSRSKDGQKRWGYLLHTQKLPPEIILNLKKSFDVLCITGFKLKSTGELHLSINSNRLRALGAMKKQRTEIVPLISFHSLRAGKEFLSNRVAQERSVIAFKKLIDNYTFRSLHLDFEYLPPSFAQKYSDFILLLKKRLDHITISCAVFPPVEFPKKYNGFHNLNLLNKVADEIVIMCYDKHNPRTNPGPVTSIAWSKKNINYALKFFPGNKIWLGIPAYGYAWNRNGKTTVITARKGAALSKIFKSYRHNSGTVYLRYKQKRVKYRAWYSDFITRKKLTDIAQKQNLKGTALWRIGFEE